MCVSTGQSQYTIHVECLFPVHKLIVIFVLLFYFCSENLTDSEAMDETDAGARNKKDAYRCGYEEIRHRHSPPSWGPSQFSKNHHPLQIMVNPVSLNWL